MIFSLLLSCLYPVVEPARRDIPGSWVARDVQAEHFGIIEVDSDLSVQLYFINENEVNGYISHRNGTVLIQDKYYIEPCVGYQLRGKVLPSDDGFKTDCMYIEAGVSVICIEMDIGPDWEFADFKIFGAQFDSINFDEYYSNEGIRNNHLPICY